MAASNPTNRVSSDDSGLVLFLHADGAAAPAPHWLASLRETGLRCFSRAAWEGTEQTSARLDDLGDLCLELQQRAPGAAVLILACPLQPHGNALRALSELVAAARGPGAYTTLSNAAPRNNPWSGMTTSGTSVADRERLVALLGAGKLYPIERLPRHLLALNAQAVDALAETGLRWRDGEARLRGRHVDIELADWIYVETPDQPANLRASLDAQEIPRPQPWGALRERLQDWLAANSDADPFERLPLPGSKPVTLHLTHSWGGGVAAWIESFIDADPDGMHLQLRSEGPQRGEGAGQRLALYLGKRLHSPMDSWWLQPAIESAVSHHGQYREILETICERYGVGRILVSSLVGHSIDALRSERPTVQVIHDPFPAWPLLSIHPEEYDGSFEAALADPRAREQFADLAPEKWARIRAQYGQAAQIVHRVAPTRAAAETVSRLVPELDAENVTIIPHGLPALKPRKATGERTGHGRDGRLRIVVPGRMQSGKGAALLEAALPELRKIAHLTLLGSGKGGERFYGKRGVNIVLQYERESLPELLDTVQPDLALLPSVVPETFSYALSEMWAMGVPVLATRLGSFAERIEDGTTGWLTDPEPEALITAVRRIASDRPALDRVRVALERRPGDTVTGMVAAYAALCPPTLRAPRRPMSLGSSLDVAEVQAGARADALQRLTRLGQEQAARRAQLEALVEERTAWARQEERQLAETRRTLGKQLEAQTHDLAARAAHIQALDKQINAIRAQLQETRSTLEDARSTLDDTQNRLSQVLDSRSWKLTRPLRVSRRALAAAVQLRAWNPLRWPLLVSQLVRNLSTVGLRGTVHRMQRFEAEPAPRRPDNTTIVSLPATTTLPESMPFSETPRVSVVIPAFNHLDHTAACLDSISRAVDTTPLEVILVDDCSSDETQAKLHELPGLRYLRNEENGGFIHSCNRGLAAARGEYVLFLNNDTQVEDRWLERLLAVFEARSDAGLVGARLVYPDGSLQECGGMVFADGSGWNYGRGDDPDKPEYQYLRETDYCSGACIMLRRDLLDQLGGFDTHYAPAYYEDTDLAFRVRAAGLNVYVQPSVTITHFEGVSSGTDLSSGTKRYQLINQEKFRERWQEALAEQPSPIEDPADRSAVLAARDHRKRGRVLLIDAYTPEPDQDSGSVRLVNLMGCLLELGEAVTFLPENRGWHGRYTRTLQRMGVEAVYDPWAGSVERFLRERGPEFDVIIISRHYVAGPHLAALRKHAPQARFLFDTVDLHYLREERLAALENSTALRQVAKQTKRSELAVIRAADATLVVSPVEQMLLAEEAPAAAVHILSNIHAVTGRGRDFAGRKDIYFVGGYQHPPNSDAAQWFVREIWPLVRERLPGVQFHLLGSKATDEVRALGTEADVEFHGFVERLEPFLDECRLAVAPLRYGAGVKGKVNQAMAHGQPVVASPAAVEGLNAIDGEDVLVADTAQAFADAVVRLYNDEALWNRLSENGLENVRQHFSREAAKRNIKRLFETLEREPRNTGAPGSGA